MATLKDHPRLRLAFLCLMYLAQGLPFGFVTVALAAYLATDGATTGEIGRVVAMAVLPWSFKWAWGPLVDSGRLAALGRRRPWIMIAQMFMVVTAAFLAWVPTGQTVNLSWMVCLHNVFVGLQDVAVDALAVDMLEGKDREQASGMMYGSSILGTFLGGAGLGMITAWFGIAAAIATMVAMQVAFLTVAVLVRERPGDAWLLGRITAEDTHRATQPSITGMARTLGRAMVRPPALLAATGAVAMKILPQTLAVLMTVHLIDVRGWTQERYATVTGGGGVLLGLFASIAGGFVASRVGPRRTAVAANALLGAVWIVFGMLVGRWDQAGVVFGWVAMDTICQSMTTVALFALFMRVASPNVAATQFTASMALMNLATTAGSWLAGPIGDICDVATAFLIAGFLQPLTGFLLPRDLAAAAARDAAA